MVHSDVFRSHASSIDAGSAHGDVRASEILVLYHGSRRGQSDHAF